MTSLLSGLTRFGDLVTDPFGGHAAWALAMWAVVFGVLAIVLFKVATPQRRLAAARDRLVGRLLEAAIYQNSLRTLLAVQGALVVANLRYLVLALPALAALALPLVLVLPQLDARFGRRPLEVGEAMLVTITAHQGSGFQLASDPGLAVESGPLRDPGRGELVWRVRAVEAGRHDLILSGAAGDEMTLEVSVAEDGLPALAAARHRSGLSQLLHDPAAVPLPAASPVERFGADIPARDVRLFGVVAHWLVGFTLVSLMAGLVLKRPLRVEL